MYTEQGVVTYSNAHLWQDGGLQRETARGWGGGPGASWGLSCLTSHCTPKTVASEPIPV